MSPGSSSPSSSCFSLSISSRSRAASSNSRLRACLYISASSRLISRTICSGDSMRRFGAASSAPRFFLPIL